MNDVCSATVADARRLCAQMGLEPLGRKPTPQVPLCRTNPSDRGNYVFERRSVGAAGLPSPASPVAPCSKPIIALCIIIIEFEIGSSQLEIV